MWVELLDYPKANIRIIVETEWERQWRSQSAFKEPETAAWIDEFVQEGDSFWDVGACVGSYGLIAASRGAKVWMIEPETANVARIHENCALNPDLDISVYSGAASDVDGMTTLSVTHGKPGAAGNYIRGMFPKAYHEELKEQRKDAVDHEIEVKRLDTLTEEWGQPDHVKIDVDGHELQVVRGGADTLRKCKSVMVEVSHGEGMLEEIQDVFKDFEEAVFMRSGNDFNHRFVRP